MARSRALSPLLALLLAACAHAPPATVGKGTCAADADRLCAGVPPGDGRVLECLKTRPETLSEPCRLAVAAPQEVAEALAEDCRADAARACPGVPAGDGRLWDCMRSSWSALVPRCQTALWAAQEKQDQLQAICGKELGRWCPEVRPGQGRVLACLKAHDAELSPVCRALLAR